ncbi:hypothetical protein P7K49_030313 [Saguinus oedipus]|uniref:Peptidase S1 domain-containing protein n=1 Tax=Saguinus oedipus TaxID=9490 RepID=A0ABQ9U2M7_SAGOE|nr:hypothetical protein P7K49_030313 [Saguinus oedipus]
MTQTASDVSVLQVIVHSRYRAQRFWSWVGKANDIGLLKLGQELKYSKYIWPVCLPGRDYVVKDHSLCTVTGWGLSKADGESKPPQTRAGAVKTTRVQARALAACSGASAVGEQASVLSNAAQQALMAGSGQKRWDVGKSGEDKARLAAVGSGEWPCVNGPCPTGMWPQFRTIQEKEVIILNNKECDKFYHNFTKIPPVVRIIQSQMICAEDTRREQFCYVSGLAWLSRLQGSLGKGVWGERGEE